MERLTAPQRAILEWAERIADGLIDECEAFTPRNGQHAVCNRMMKRGLLRDAGWGVDLHDHMREVPLYAITDAGRRALAADSATATTEPR